MQLKYYSLIFSIAGLLILYFLSTLTQPIAIELSRIPKYEDKQVIVEGIVTEHHVTSYESQIIKIEDNNTTATVFIDGKSDVEYGDRIQITGKVQKYKGEWEITVSDDRLIIILQKWQNITTPLWQLAENPMRYTGLNVNVTGYVDAVYDTYFYLVDSEDAHSVIVFYNSSLDSSIYSGQKVCVTARFDYDTENLRYEMHGISISKSR